MDHASFDELSRRFAVSGSRRGALQAVLGAIAAGVAPGVAEATNRRRHGHKNGVCR